MFKVTVTKYSQDQYAVDCYSFFMTMKVTQKLFALHCVCGQSNCHKTFKIFNSTFEILFLLLLLLYFRIRLTLINRSSKWKQQKKKKIRKTLKNEFRCLFFNWDVQYVFKSLWLIVLYAYCIVLNCIEMVLSIQCFFIFFFFCTHTLHWLRVHWICYLLTQL